MSNKPLNKADIVARIAEKCDVSKKDADAMLDALTDLMKSEMSKDGNKVFVLPGVLNISIGQRPAMKERTGTNPFTGKPMVVAAKPARASVRIRALKVLKDAA